MPLHFVSGDPLLTQCQTLAVGHNRLGRREMDDVSQALRQKSPVAYANYERRCKQDRQATGDLYLWTQSTPQLVFMTVRDSGVGATRLRYIQSSLMTLARDYRLYNIESLAIAPLSNRQDWADSKAQIERWLSKINIPIVIYEAYQPKIHAEESL